MQIAERILKLDVGGDTIPIGVRIFAPQQIENERTWSCAYEIDWPKGLRKSAGFGIDGVQAILIAMQKIGAKIYTSDYHTSGQLYLDTPGNGYGFPVTSNIRDLLVGDDALYHG